MKLYVGNLPYSTTEDELKELFSSFGEVLSAIIITDRSSGRSKGFGFVEFETEEAGQKAIEEMNDSEVGGRSIKVSKARPKRE